MLYFCFLLCHESDHAIKCMTEPMCGGGSRATIGPEYILFTVRSVPVPAHMELSELPPTPSSTQRQSILVSAQGAPLKINLQAVELEGRPKLVRTLKVCQACPRVSCVHDSIDFV